METEFRKKQTTAFPNSLSSASPGRLRKEEEREPGNEVA